MRLNLATAAFALTTLLAQCNSQTDTAVLTHDSAMVSNVSDTILANERMIFELEESMVDSSSAKINVGEVSRDELVAFAKTKIGIPYKYASSDPSQGFDCSGYITHVFSHFKIEVPRSSVQFTNVGEAVSMQEAKKGDLILFTGTDTSETKVGHMGIILENTDSLRFLHSTSGKAYGVTATAFNDYYKARFVKVISIF